MEPIVTYEDKTYVLSYDEIKVGDSAYSPLSGAVFIIDEEDDLVFVNGAYYLAKLK